MTQNEVNIIKNSVLDATEAYVDARLSVADFVKTQIGVTVGTPTKGLNGKYYHTVKCNTTSSTSGITYSNVLSVGNIEFPADSVVFLIAPNAQFTNQFILGKLDDTPCNIVGGSIKIGRIGSSNNYYFNVDSTGNLIINNKFKVANTGALYIGGTDTSSAKFYVTDSGSVTIKSGSIDIGSNFSVNSSGNITAKGGTIGGFEITSSSIGTPINVNGVGMSNGGGHGVNLYAWHSDYNCRVYQGKITCSTGSVSDRGIYVYSGSDESENYILYGHSSIYRSSDGYEAVFSSVSDKRLKKNIKDITLDEAKNLIYNLSPKKFEYKNKTLYGKGERYGFIAQELRKNINNNSGIEFVTDKGYHGINYDDFIAPLCVIVQDQQKQIDALKEQIKG